MLNKPSQAEVEDDGLPRLVVQPADRGMTEYLVNLQREIRAIHSRFDQLEGQICRRGTQPTSSGDAARKIQDLLDTQYWIG